MPNTKPCPFQLLPYYGEKANPFFWYSIFLAILWSICALPAQAQIERPNCQEMIREGDRQLATGDPDLDQTLKAYLNALNCDAKLAGRVGPKIDLVFKLIHAQKKEAETALAEVKKQ